MSFKTTAEDAEREGSLYHVGHKPRRPQQRRPHIMTATTMMWIKRFQNGPISSTSSS